MDSAGGYGLERQVELCMAKWLRMLDEGKGGRRAHLFRIVSEGMMKELDQIIEDHKTEEK